MIILQGESHKMRTGSCCALFCCGHIDGLVQDCSNSIANALELQQSCTKPSIFSFIVDSRDSFTHIRQISFTVIGLSCCQWSNLDECTALQSRHNGCHSVSNHQPHDCLLNRLFRRRSNKTSKPRFTGLCAWNSPGTGEFPAQMASCKRGKCFHLMTPSCKKAGQSSREHITTGLSMEICFVTGPMINQPRLRYYRVYILKITNHQL